MSEYLFFEPPVTSYELSDQLMHHGVKGMKWGIRKDRRSPFEKRYKNKDTIEMFDQMNKISYVSRPTALDRMNLKQRYLEAKKNSFRRTLRNTPIDSKLEKAIKRYERASDKSWTEHERKPYDPDRHEKAIEEKSRAYKQVTKEMLRSIGAKNLKDEDIQRVINHHWADEILDTYWGANPKYPLPLYPGMNVKDSKKVAHSDGMTDELYHHGVKGMKWGIRRYQPYSLIPRGSGEGGKFIGDAAKKVKATAGKIVQTTKKGVSSTIKAAGGAVKSASDRRKARAEARELNRKARHEAAKQKAIESGSLEDIAKFKKELTHEEIGKALTRIQDEQRIDDMVAKAKTSAAWDRADAFMSKVSKVSGYIGTAANVYQNVTNLKKNQQGLKDFNKSQEDKAKDEANKKAVDKMIKKQQWDKLNEFARKNGLDQNEYSRIATAAENQKKLKSLTTSEKAKRDATEKLISTGSFSKILDNADLTAEQKQQAYKRLQTEQKIRSTNLDWHERLHPKADSNNNKGGDISNKELEKRIKKILDSMKDDD